jgi:hypothetical protein
MSEAPGVVRWHPSLLPLLLSPRKHYSEHLSRIRHSWWASSLFLLPPPLGISQFLAVFSDYNLRFSPDRSKWVFLCEIQRKVRGSEFSDVC